ncbi:MAG: UDP-N-acetylmuramoyl-tripeptide--D-alanyl-D-alanine ligase [Candidatus Peribacteraceae bacterium]|jgi:UDP-N-acetylmuramoyl-tripeptide--D-alanyl-D-alanine ligase
MDALLLTVPLGLLAALSPLLTYASLWQVKEWRWDRLREEIVRERTILPLVGGKIRPLLVIVYAITLFFLRTGSLVPATLLLLSLLTVIQFAFRKQRTPVWTSKAKALVALALLLDTALIIAAPFFFRHAPFVIPLLPLLQSAVLTLSWALFLPVDRALKRRIFAAARAVRSAHPELLVIGITGSVGKTTTKELLAHVLSGKTSSQAGASNNPSLLSPAERGQEERGQVGEVLFTPAHVNTEVGVAQWMLKNLSGKTIPRGTPLIIEMGAYRKGEIRNLCSIVQPRFGIVTFIGNQHLALFGSSRALLEAKGELLQALPDEGHAFLNGDCERCRDMRAFCRCPVTVVGTGGAADLEAFDIEETTSGIRFTVGDVPFSLPLHGTHNVANILLVIAVAERLGISRKAIAERIRTFTPPHRTFEVRRERDVTVLDDTHNASAASFKAAIAWAKNQPFERKILLTSGIIELGEEHERTHRELGMLSAAVFHDAVFLDPGSATFFAEGYGKPVSSLTRLTPRVPAGSLLVCVGRMSPATLQRFLPFS